MSESEKEETAKASQSAGDTSADGCVGEKKQPRFGTLRGVVQMSAAEFELATRPMSKEEVESFLAGRG